MSLIGAPNGGGQENSRLALITIPRHVAARLQEGPPFERPHGGALSSFRCSNCLRLCSGSGAEHVVSQGAGCPCCAALRPCVLAGSGSPVSVGLRSISHRWHQSAVQIWRVVRARSDYTKTVCYFAWAKSPGSRGRRTTAHGRSGVRSTEAAATPNPAQPRRSARGLFFLLQFVVTALIFQAALNRLAQFRPEHRIQHVSHLGWQRNRTPAGIHAIREQFLPIRGCNHGR